MRRARRLGMIIAVALFSVGGLATVDAAPPIHNIIVDQIGYRPTAPKYVMFAWPREGQYSELPTFDPGKTFEVCRTDGTVVFSGPVVVWNQGAMDTASGDVVWRGNFTSVTQPGQYYVSVPGGTDPGARSYEFEIGSKVYAPLLEASVRTYYYQRCGTEIDAAHGGNWVHQACHVGPRQDTQANLWDGGDKGQPRDVSGGWHDAGDYRKYLPWVFPTMWSLMHSAEWYPQAYTDDTGIPESGNGVPDVLDEAKWELDWMLKMQREDGATYAVVGVTGSDGGSPPNKDKAKRYYSNISTSATSTVAMAAALGSRLFSRYEQAYPGYSAKLQDAALRAWAFLERNPERIAYNQKGFAQNEANCDDREDLCRRVAAAADLFALTGDPKYRKYFDVTYDSPDARFSGRFETWPAPLQLGMVSYALAQGATPDVVSYIKQALLSGIDENIMFWRDADPYKAYIGSGYYWGSNRSKGQWANVLLWGVKLGVDPARNGLFLAVAQEYMHYINGRNPLNLVYLTNTGTKGLNAGADKPIMEIYHGWFWDGSALYDGEKSTFGPAPGFLAGGPNQTYSAGDLQSPPAGQPPMKSYKDWNTSWPQDSWSVTETAIDYQAAYTFMASAFVSLF